MTSKKTIHEMIPTHPVINKQKTNVVKIIVDVKINYSLIIKPKQPLMK